MHKLITLVATSLFISPLPAPTRVDAQSRGNADNLKVAAEMHRANREKIKTWQGKATLTARYETSGWSNKCSIEFVCDNARGSLLWKCRFDEVTYPASVKSPSFSNGVFFNGMVHDGKLYQLRSNSYRGRSNTRPDGSQPRGLVIIPPENAVNYALADGYFYPMCHMTHTGGLDIEASLLGFHKMMADHPDSGLVVARDGDIIDFSNTDKSVVNRFVFDLAQGGNIILSHFEEKGHSSDWRYDWQKVGDAWVPKRFERETQETVKNAIKINMRIVEWTENRVNEPIAPDAFTLKALGVEKGDIVSDNIANKSYRFNGP